MKVVCDLPLEADSRGNFVVPHGLPEAYRLLIYDTGVITLVPLRLLTDNGRPNRNVVGEPIANRGACVRSAECLTTL